MKGLSQKDLGAVSTFGECGPTGSLSSDTMSRPCRQKDRDSSIALIRLRILPAPQSVFSHQTGHRVFRRLHQGSRQSHR